MIYIDLIEAGRSKVSNILVLKRKKNVKKRIKGLKNSKIK